MNDTARFCSKCGTGLAEGAQFCASCGGPVATAPVAAPPPGPAPAAPLSASTGGGEQVHSVISSATVKAGFMGVKSKQYTMVLTDRRVVFARITGAMMKQLVADARDGAKAEGKGFFGQWGAQMSSYSAFAERYLEMSPDAALAETADNFAIDRSTITKASLKTSEGYDENTSTTDLLIIKTTGKKYKIILGSGKSKAKQALLAARMI
ncbi:MAG: zinc ribbon domain-containing protein [Coriobacteriia bacterium]|nr:zinc ribbon domain-containing protein [Coriobacteriia bacterium]